jgi:CDP-paratose 2-epimerase
MRYLVTGGCGFVGSNMARAVQERGEELLVLDNLSRHGTEKNLEWLKASGQIDFIQIDTRDRENVEQAIQKFQPDVIVHLAGQVAMTTSLSDPRRDFETNVVGGFNVLESLRKFVPNAMLLYSSTNKVYGDLEQVACIEGPLRYVAPEFSNGFDESLPLDFRSPYGCSKGATDQYVLDYARMYGLRTVVFRHSSIYGGRQFSTYDQGWVGWFVKQAVERQNDPSRQPFTISGNGKQVRDVLFASDLVDMYLSAIRAIESVRGEVFNIGGGMENSLSLLELFDLLEQYLGVKMTYRVLPWRQSDQKIFVADIRKAERLLGWTPKVTKETGLRRMIDWTKNNG